MRFYTYSDTHELELADRIWRCKWCHKKGKDLIADCTGNLPQPKKAFQFKKPTKKALRRQQGRRLWGRPQLRRERPLRDRRRGGRLSGGKQLAWPSEAEAQQLNILTPPKQGPGTDKGAGGPPEHPGRPPEIGEAGFH